MLCNKSIQNAVKGIANHNIKPRYLGACVPSFLLEELLWNSSFLYSTAFNFDIKYGDKIIEANSEIFPPGRISTSNCTRNITPLGNNQNIRFQKLSLFIREVMNPVFCWFGILSFNCLASFSSSKGLVKSCMSVISNHQFNILGIILSGIRTLFKGITGTILFLSLLILSNTGAYATDIPSSNLYWLKKYIAAVEQRNQIPRGLLSAIAIVESDFKPYAVNIEGKPIIANNKSEAVKTIRNALNSGITNIDIGIAQINYRWHKDNFKNIEEMINPVTNIEYAAKLLSSLFKQHKTWHKAIRHYHSANPDHHRRYSRKVVIAWVGNSQLIK